MVKEDRESWRVKEDLALGVGLSNQLASSSASALSPIASTPPPLG